MALGTAFNRSGLSDQFASWLTQFGDGQIAPHTMLAILLIATGVLTQVLNNLTTAVIMTDIAVELANALGVSEMPFIMAVVTGSSLAFLSPIAHQANAMVMGPGGYKYRDYVVAGAPLAVLTMAASIYLLPVLWPF